MNRWQMIQDLRELDLRLMLRLILSVLRYIAVPLLLWWGPLLAGAVAFEPETAAVWVMGWLCLGAAVILPWWGICLARWLHFMG